MAVSPALRVQLLGGFRVLVDGQPVRDGAWRSTRAAALVKLLALAPDHRLHREQVMDALWPELDPDAQANNLNVAASRARQALASAGAPPASFITRAGDVLLLGPPECVWVDVAAFERAADEGNRSDDPAVLRAALALYGGDLLPDDTYEAWGEARRVALRARAHTLVERLGRLHAARGEIDLAIEAYTRLLLLDPTHEAAHLALMRLYARTGRRAEALAQYERLVAALRQELDVAPGRAASDLAAAIRAGRYPAPREGDAPAPSPPARAAGAAFPLAPLTDLIGREREIADLRRLLATGRLVTLTGPGGIGKTRLARAVAEDQRSRFADGLVFVDLSAIRDPALVVPTVAEALGVRGQAGRPTVELLAAHLRETRLLLILDNFEQVVDAAPLIPLLLARARGVHVLVTSRVALRVEGETEYAVSGLALPEGGSGARPSALLDAPAVTLFVERAREARPDFALTEENAAPIAEVCRRLDGLPLAIELAAARIKVLTPAAMLTRLDHPLALLAHGRRDLPARQQTIRATIAWSHDLLSPAEQRLLRRLAVFVGGWTLEAAEAVVDPRGDLGIDVLDGLTSLVDKSLVRHRDLSGDEARFTMLETIREFGAERLAEAGEAEVLRDRHAAVLLDVAERATPHLEGADLAVWMARLDREDGNLRAALAWASARADAETALRFVAALRVYWFVPGRLADACDACLAVAMLPGSERFPGLRIDALNAAGFFARESGDYDRAEEVSRQALTESERLGDRKRAADALANLGFVALQRGRLAEAHALLTTCLDDNRALGNQQGIADALSFLGLIAYYEGDLPTARRLDEECLAIWDELADVQAVSYARIRLGQVLLAQGAHQAAYHELMDGLRLARDLDFWWGLTWACNCLAQLASERGLPSLAIALVVEGDAIRAHVGLRLPPTEQVEVDRLWRTLETDLGAAAFAQEWATREERGWDELIATVERVLGAALTTP